MAEPIHHTQFAMKLLIALLVINLFTITFAYFVGQNADVNNPVLTQLSTLENSTVQTSNSLGKSFNGTALTGLSAVACTGFFCSNPLNTISNILITIANLIASFVGVIINLLILMAYSIYIIVFIFFQLIPSLFTASSFGVLAPLFTIIYGFAILVIIIVGIDALIKNITPFIPFISGHKK